MPFAGAIRIAPPASENAPLSMLENTLQLMSSRRGRSVVRLPNEAGPQHQLQPTFEIQMVGHRELVETASLSAALMAQATESAYPIFMCLSERLFTKAPVVDFASRSLIARATPVSASLGCFTCG
jgi:hypothetical protein